MSETIAGLRAHLDRQITLTMALREFLDGRPTPAWPAPDHNISRVQIRTYQALLRGMEISASTLLHLTEDVGNSVRDCFPIARSIIETSINASYIAASGIAAAEQARRHSLTRSVLDLDRHLTIGSLALRHRSSSLDEPDSVQGLREALETLDQQTGKRRYEWTPLSAPKRIEVVLNQLGTPIAGLLAQAYFAVYRDASEVVHGTVYGCFFSFGETIVDQDIALQDHTFVVLFASSIAINRAIAAIGAAHQLENVVHVADCFDLLLTELQVFAEALERARARDAAA